MEIRDYIKTGFWTVYQIQNMINDKLYIGITSKTIEQRLSEHIRDTYQGGRYALNNAIRKYGAENFTISVLEIVDSLQEAQRYETEYILDFDTIANGSPGAGGYNMTFGGETPD